MHSYLRKLQYTNSLVAFICSINFMFLCSYCATLGKLGGGLGEVSCNSERDCVPNAYCIDSRYCTCKDSFVQDSMSNSCLPRAVEINDSCTINVQCTSSFGTHSECYSNNVTNNTGYCKCVKNAHFQDGICYESMHLGGFCKVSDNCVSLSGVPTYCAYSTCVCASGFHPSDDRLDCLPDIALGKTCTSDEDCVAENSYCSGVCYCQSGYVSSVNETSCLPAARNLRAQCFEDSQCQRFLVNTFCDSTENKCKCVPFSHELDQSCWISASLGMPCLHRSQCVTPSTNVSKVSCSQGFCTCADGYTRMDAECTVQKDESAESSSLEKSLFILVAAVILSLPSD